MLVVPEALIAGLVSEADALEAVRGCFAAMARGEARNFPVVREALGEGRQYGFKSGLDTAGGMLGVKAGDTSPAMPRGGSPTTSRWSTCSTPKAGGPRRWWGGTC